MRTAEEKAREMKMAEEAARADFDEVGFALDSNCICFDTGSYYEEIPIEGSVIPEERKCGFWIHIPEQTIAFNFEDY